MSVSESLVVSGVSGNQSDVHISAEGSLTSLVRFLVYLCFYRLLVAVIFTQIGNNFQILTTETSDHKYNFEVSYYHIQFILDGVKI